MSSFPKVNTNNREMIVWTYWSHVHISIRAQTFLESAEETVESSPMETVPTTLAEAGFHLVVISPREARREAFFKRMNFCPKFCLCLECVDESQLSSDGQMLLNVQREFESMVPTKALLLPGKCHGDVHLRMEKI